MDNTLFGLINLSRPSTDTFRERDNNAVLPTLRVACVCLCRQSQCLYDTFFDLLNLFHSFWGMFRERHDNTATNVSALNNYKLHARGSETLQIFTFRLLKGKERTSVTFRIEGNIPISVHVFAFLLIVEQGIVFIHDAAIFFLHVCAFA
jgi:hypothetical protein